MSKDLMTYNDIDLDISKVYTFDIETDGLKDYTVIHCMVLEDLHTKEIFEYTPDEIVKGLTKLSTADVIVGHNIIGFDLKVIKDLYPEQYNPLLECEILDTLVMSRLLSNNRIVRDEVLIAAQKMANEDFLTMDSFTGRVKSLKGSHSLEAWGRRLSRLDFKGEDWNKGDFGKTTDWKEYTPEMLAYCRQDVILNTKLLELLLKAKDTYNCPWLPIQMECELQFILTEQERYGCAFDLDKATGLYGLLIQRRENLKEELRQSFNGWTETMKTPLYYTAEIDDRKFKAVTKSQLSAELYASFQSTDVRPRYKVTKKWLNKFIKPGPLRTKHHPFNPGSASDIEREFRKKYKWRPKEYNYNGTAKCGVEVLKDLDYPEAKLLVELEVVQDRLEKLAEGKRNPGYIHDIGDDGRIHHHVNTLGTITNRCAHSRPNLGQVPATGVLYGEAFRSLFTASEGRVLVGSDLSGIEMRVQAEYMHEWDDGEFIKSVVFGKSSEGTDAHSRNAEILKCDRATAKTFYYAMIYGGGMWKLGDTVGITDTDMNNLGGPMPQWISAYLDGQGKAVNTVNRAKVMKGKKLKERMIEGTPALANMIDRSKEQHSTQGYITSLDGRPIFTRAAHSAFNSTLQSGGSIVAKFWVICVNRLLTQEQIDAKQVWFVHDEIALDTLPEDAERVQEICKEAIKLVEKFLDFKCPLDVDTKVGKNWLEIH